MAKGQMAYFVQAGLNHVEALNPYNVARTDDK